jgi:hypothetical protein
MSEEKNLGGAPTLEEQAVNRHKEGEVRFDISMGKLMPDAIKKFQNLYKNEYENLKYNQKLDILKYVFAHNKEFMKEMAKLEAKDVHKAMQDSLEDEDDFMPTIQLTPSKEKSLN